jgi:hypothetical protein
MKKKRLDALPPGSKAQMTSRSSMITEAFVNWLTHFSRYKAAGSCLLASVGATSHLDHSTVETADRHDYTVMPSKSDCPCTAAYGQICLWST